MRHFAKALFLSAGLIGSFSWTSVNANEFTGNATPTKYLLGISMIEFHRSGDPQDVYITYATGSGNYDIASVSPNANVGVLNATGTLPVGTYDKVRFTVSKTMTIQASIAALSDGQPCRTESTPQIISNPVAGVSAAYLGERDGGAAEPETVVVPTGSSAEPSPDFTDLGSSFRGTLPVNFTVTSASPTITLKFNVTNAVMFMPYGVNQCVVFPGPPAVSVGVR